MLRCVSSIANMCSIANCVLYDNSAHMHTVQVVTFIILEASLNFMTSCTDSVMMQFHLWKNYTLNCKDIDA